MTPRMDAAEPAVAPPVENVILAIHGGCGVESKADLTPELERQIRAALEASLRAGQAQLDKPTATSLDAVVAAVKVLEDSPLFNAGKGAAFNRDGRNELDAALMDGATRRAGAVAAATTVKNPITAARAVMERSRHVLIVGPGADRFAQASGCEIVDPSYFRTEKRWQDYQDRVARETKKASQAPPQQPLRDVPRARFGTVGAVALDRHGRLAAGTSTGGLTLKHAGRVGDSPIIGAGTYADNASVAVSATGDGEYFLRAVAAHDIAALVQYRRLDVAAAAHEVIHKKITPAGGEGAVLVLDPKARLAMTYNTEGMYRAYLTRDGKITTLIYDR